ncbi:MAG: class I SAM-dependent methyltransferase [Pirellulales bacterium]
MTFISTKSEDVLPSFTTAPLSLALIDGWHAFPGPFLDWFFISRLLAVGGCVIVDDVQLRACGILRDFLKAEAGRWKQTGRVLQSEMFTKLTNALFVGDWETQPFGAKPRFTVKQRIRRRLIPAVALARKVPILAAVLDAIRRKDGA